MIQEINFFYEEVTLNINEEATKGWLFDCLKDYAIKTNITLNYIFCDDEYLLEINKEHLNHDYYTDIITFDYCDEENTSGDLFISIDRVKDNAKQLNIEFNEELKRVIIHGLLHLIGFKDKTEEDASIMRENENKCLSKL